MRRRTRKSAPAAVLLLAAAGAIAVLSCSTPGPASKPEEIAALRRASIRATAEPPEAETPSLSYLHAGKPDDPRLIYIHGTPGSAEAWADFLTSPVPGFESIAVDRLGFGQSKDSRGGRSGVDSFQEQADAIAPLLVERDGHWPILVGHSLGGPIAARLATMYPERVRGLIIVAGSLDPAQEKPGLGQAVATTDFIRFFLPQTLDNSMGELAAAKKQTELLAPELSKITCPVIVIHGASDQLVPYANVDYITKMLTNAKSVSVVRLDKQGHFVPWERPEAIRNAVAELGASR
ncbi:MAG: alpha/beta hydrolase [Phycisphaeraceae bacterium]|nr:alpha/beta hydrolase [Phycisphaeraceae bacterium]